jgi:hypothetical protein
MAKIMTEKDFYNTLLKPNLEKMGYFCERIELYGHPDVHICKNGRSQWLELKTLDDYPISASTRIKPEWRMGQLSWLQRFRAKGGYGYLALWIGGDVWFLIPQQDYSRGELSNLSRGLSGGLYDTGSNK